MLVTNVGVIVGGLCLGIPLLTGMSDIQFVVNAITVAEQRVMPLDMLVANLGDIVGLIYLLIDMSAIPFVVTTIFWGI